MEISPYIYFRLQGDEDAEIKAEREKWMSRNHDWGLTRVLIIELEIGSWTTKIQVAACSLLLTSETQCA